MKQANRVLPLAALALGGLLFLREAPLAAQSAPAAPPAGLSAPTPQQVVDKMDGKLSLTADQKAKITPIVADRQAKFKALADNTSLTRPQRAQQMRAIWKDSDGQINAILTPEQQQKYTEYKQELREQMKEHAQQHAAPN